MAATLKQFAPYDPVAEELWRVAETGDVDALDQIFLRRVDVNARNKHGMTALMKAAYHGHERMVRTLLQHGADPNLFRNDKFTALALAAFFGHTRTVRILIEHGAKKEVITRCGASAHTWATARIFEEAARYLASPAPAPAPVPAQVVTFTPAPVSPAPAPAPAAAPAPVPEVRSLKDPPEIWDLVHEVPRDFNAGSAFVTRLKSMKTSFVLGVAVVLLVSAACVIGLAVRRRSQARNLAPQPSVIQNVIGSGVSVPSHVEDTSSATAVTEPIPEAPITNDKRPRKVKRQLRPVTTVAEEPVQTVESREVPAAPPVTVATPKPEPRKPAVSPQLISPTTNAPKAKVIQWP